MSQLTLVPAAYRCPDHDNEQIVTARVRERVELEVSCAERPAAAFRVAVTCPGSAIAPDSAHRRVFDGRWQLA